MHINNHVRKSSCSLQATVKMYVHVQYTYMLEDEHFVPKSGIVMYRNSNMRGFELKRARKATTIQDQICCTILYIMPQ
jgi:hypothetical protein